MANGGSHRVVGADEVRRDQILEPVVRAVPVRAAEPTVGHERVNRTALCRGAGESLVDLLSVADVAGRRPGAELSRDRTQPLDVARDQRQRRPLGCEPLGDRLADPAAAARDHDVLSHQRLHRPP
jgi:hypothetical protein